MLVECVPNFSEGRDAAVIAGLQAAVRGVTGVALLDTHQDPDHHRTVLTFAGGPGPVLEAAFRAVAQAVRTIDMTRHAGAHPRIGAADVVPFVPLRGATLDDCARLADALAERLARELDLPVYLYARSARRPERARLPWLREPEFEGLAAALATPERAPDLGPARPHPTAGATVTGARGLLVAFNVDLQTDDLKLAKKIARTIRTSSGGLPGLQAKGLLLALQRRVQVTMNLLEPDRVGPGQAFAEVQRLAREAGVEVASSELVGLVPRAAVAEAAGTLLRLPSGPDGARPLAGRVLEDRLEEAGLYDPTGHVLPQLAAIASTERLAPGGGSAVAVSLAFGVACLRKALALSRGKPPRAGLAPERALTDAAIDGLVAQLPSDAALVALAREDHEAFAGLMEALGLPRSDPSRAAAIAKARGPAVEVPQTLLRHAETVAAAAAEAAERGNPNLVNDALAAAELALTAARVARVNARANRPKQAGDADDDVRVARVEAAAARARAAAG